VSYSSISPPALPYVFIKKRTVPQYNKEKCLLRQEAQVPNPYRTSTCSCHYNLRFQFLSPPTISSILLRLSMLAPPTQPYATTFPSPGPYSSLSLTISFVLSSVPSVCLLISFVNLEIFPMLLMFQQTRTASYTIP
jgi:hypothetical protein